MIALLYEKTFAMTAAEPGELGFLEEERLQRQYPEFSSEQFHGQNEEDEEEDEGQEDDEAEEEP